MVRFLQFFPVCFYFDLASYIWHGTFDRDSFSLLAWVKGKYLICCGGTGSNGIVASFDGATFVELLAAGLDHEKITFFFVIFFSYSIIREKKPRAEGSDDQGQAAKKAKPRGNWSGIHLQF